MAIIVDKEEKRRNIALSCRDLLLEKGIRNLTISEIAKTASIGKGTVYEYFLNKEDIVFEIISSIIESHRERLKKMSISDISTKEKIRNFYFLFENNKKSQRELRAYQEFLAISVTDPTQQMVEFSQKCNQMFQSISAEIIRDAIENGELKPEAATIIPHLSIYHTGLIVETTKSAANAKEEINSLLDSLFKLLETK